MNKHIKFTVPLLAISGALFLSTYETKAPAPELVEAPESQSAPLSEHVQINSEEDILIAEPESIALVENDIFEREVIVFESTADYEAASRYGNLPSHMSDIAIERFSVNNLGQLVVNENVKNIFEFFLMASHVEGEEQVLERIKEYIELSLDGEAATLALDIANNYLLYKDNLHTDRFAMSTDFSQEENLKMLRTALDDKKQTRRQYLGESVSEVLFGHEERYDDYSYQRLVINSDSTLSAQEKDKRLARAEQNLPAEMAEDFRYKREEKKLNTKIEALRNQTGKEQEIYGLRADFYGEKVAKRMEYLESNTPEWQARVNDFYQLQNDILASGSLSEDEKRQAIIEAKQNAFSHKEQIKLAVQAIRGV